VTFLYFPQLKILPFWHSWGYQDRITGSADHSHRSQLPGCILKNGRSTGNTEYAQKRTTSKVMVVRRPKVSFWPDGSTSSGNYG
jgi:hypothetical protein